MILDKLAGLTVSTLNIVHNGVKTVEIATEVAVEMAESWQADVKFERSELAASRKAALQSRIAAQKAALEKATKK